jgi:hypothetical protein
MSLPGRAELLGLLGPVTVVRTVLATTAERQRAVESSRAVSIVRRLCREVESVGAFADIRGLIPHTSSGPPAEDRYLAERIVDAVARGELLVIEGWYGKDGWTTVRRRPLSPNLSRPVDPEPPRAARPLSAKRGWVEIEVLDESGHRCAGLSVTIISPDGRRFEAVTDRDGYVLLEDLVDGDCQINLPSFDGTDWERG